MTDVVPACQHAESDRDDPFAELRDALAGKHSLTDRELSIVQLRFGIGVDRPHRIREIAPMYGVGEGRIWQLQKQALRKLGLPHLSAPRPPNRPRRPARDRSRIPVSSLSADHVLAVLASRATDIPLSTEEVTDLCLAAHVDFSGITVYLVSQWLRFLERRGLVTRYHGSDTELLHEMGVMEPRYRFNYWQLTLHSPRDHAEEDVR